MHTAEKNSPNNITDKPTAAQNAETTADEKNAENTTTNTTQKTKNEYTTPT